MSERKRGYSINDSQAIKEAKELGPYPPWDAWKPFFYNHLRKNGIVNSFGPGVEEIFHEWYVFRRKEQLGEIKSEEGDKFRKEFGDRNQEILENERVAIAFRFITDSTAKRRA